jgi:hypothetical protein
MSGHAALASTPGADLMAEYQRTYARCQQLSWELLYLADRGLVTLPPARQGCDPLDGLQLDIAPEQARG